MPRRRTVMRWLGAVRTEKLVRKTTKAQLVCANCFKPMDPAASLKVKVADETGVYSMEVCQFCAYTGGQR